MKLSEYLKKNNMTSKEYFESQKRKASGKTTLTDYRREKKNSLSQTINFDTFESDLNSMGTTIKGIYDNWQTEETMRNTRSSVESMKTRIDAYQEYQKLYGGADITDLATSYKSILDNWDNQTSVYGKFKNADAFKAEKKRLDLSDQFRVKTGTDEKTGEDIYRGYTFDEVQAAIKNFSPDSDEYKFLSNYTGYTDLKDFDKALASVQKTVEKESAESKAKLEEQINQEWYKNAKSTYDNWELPQVGTWNKEATQKSGVITYYSQKDVDAAKKERDEFLRKQLGDTTYKFFASSVTNQEVKPTLASETYYKELEQQRNIWALDHSSDLYKDVVQNEDFEQYSQYWDGHAIAVDSLKGAISNVKGSGVKGATVVRDKDADTYYIYTDPVYEYVNDVNNARRNLTEGIAYGDTKLGLEYSNKGYDMLKPEEIQIFNYLDAQGGDAAQKFLDDMEMTLTRRKGLKQSEELEKMVDSNGWAAAGLSALSIPANLVGGLGNTIANVETLVTGKDYNPYHRYRQISNLASDTREYVGENIAEATEGMELFGQNVPSFLYDTVMSMGDSLAGVSTMGVFYTPLMGMNAAQQKAKELYEQGESNDVIVQSAIASGLAEAVFEYASVDKLLKIKNIDSGKRLFTEALKQAGVEGSEEMFTEISNIISDTFIRGDNSELAQKYDELKRRGFSESEINRELAMWQASQIGWATVGGMLSGIGMGGGRGGIDFAKNSFKGKGIRNAGQVEKMLDVAGLTPTESAAYQAYNEYMGKGINADNITNAQLGNLYNSTNVDARQTLVSKETSVGEKISAMNTLNSLREIDTESTTVKRAEKLTKNKSGESANIEGIKIGDKTTVVTSDGEVLIDKANLNERDAELVARAEGIASEYGEDIANLFIAQDDGKTNVKDYTTSFNLVMEYAKHNFTQEAILKNKGVLSYDQVKNVYEATVKATFDAQQKAINDITEKHSKSVFVQGKVDDSIIDYDNTTADGSKVRWDSLTSKQRRAIKFVQLFAKATGVNIKLAKSEVIKGKHKGENGSYDPATNTITIDVYAGRIDASTTKDTILPTLSHEMTHWMKAKAPAIYNSIREDILGVFADNTKLTTDERVLAEMMRMKKAHPDQEVTPEDAIDEIVARACEDMLKNSNTTRKLLAKMSATEQQTFIEKIKETFENLMQWINDLLAQYNSESYEARFLNEYKTELKRISKQWDEMLKSAIASNQALQNEGIIAENLINGISKDGTTIAGKNNIQMSERTYENGGREFLENWLSEQSGLTEEDIKDILNQTDRIKSLMEDIRANNELPDYARWASMDIIRDENGEKVLSVIVKNGDYAMNIDFSQVCKKRVALNAVLNAMVKSGDLNFYTLSETDVADLNAIIKKHEFEIACALCFVDSKRYRVGSWAESFCEGIDKKKGKKMVHQYGFNEMVRSLIPKDSNIKVDEFNFTNRTIVGQPTSNLLSEMDDSRLDFTLIDEILEREFKAGSKPTDLYAYAKAIKDNPSLRKILNPAEIVSSIGLDAIRLESPELYRLINRHQGTAKPKFAHDVVAYGNDILKANNFTAEKAKMVGGVKCQSFSDFMANMVFDYVQFISELSAKELTAHSYTKEPLFVKLFGMTGMKINMSLVPKAVQMTPKQQKYFSILNDPNANKKSAEYQKAKRDYAKLTENAGLDEKGNYIWEDETFPYDIAMELVADPRYSANCGTIAVGISDNHILKLLNDKNISMVIPYHKRGLNHIVAMMRNIDLYNDYTKTQNTRFANGKKLEKVPDFDFYGDLYGKDGKEGTHDPKKTAENYLKWCDEHNYIPKFEKSRIGRRFRDNPNYYKLLTDFRVYDTDGTYREQQPVKPIYPENEEFKDLLLNGVVDKNGKVYGGLNQQQKTSDKLDAESQQIVDEFRNKLKKKYGKDVLAKKNSDRDTQYLELAKDPEKNDKELRKMVEDAARETGYTAKAYHGTKTDFTKFSKDKFGSNFGNWSLFGAGFYFAPTEQGAKYWGSLSKENNDVKTMPVYLHATNMLLADEPLSHNKAIEIIKEKAPTFDSEDIAWTLDRVSRFVNFLINNGYTANTVRDLFISMGYDGIDYSNLSAGKYRQYVVFDPNQIKSADPVTYDDNGNVIPLSERFNKGNNDIRYSDRENSVENENNAEYNNWESYELTSEFLQNVPASERHTFLRSLANKTNGLKRGERRDIVIITDRHVYFYKANGYMNGNIAKRSGLTKKANAEIKAWSDYYGSIDTGTTTSSQMVEGYESGRRRNDWDYDASPNSHTKRPNDEVVEQSSGSNPVGDTWEGNEDFGTDEELIVGSIIYNDNGESFQVTEDGLVEIVQFSDRLEETVYDKMGETERVQKENEKLKKDVERLRERLKIERQVTKGNYFNENQLDTVAGHLRRISSSRIDKAELINRLKDVYSYIAHSENLTWDDMFAQCCDIANSMLETSKKTFQPSNDTNVEERMLQNEASETLYEYDRAEQVRWLAREIYNQYWKVSTIKTTADRYDKQIKRLNFEHRKAMQEFRTEYEERMEDLKKTERERTKALVDRLRERKDREITEAKQYGRERLEKYKENAERKTKIQSITSNAMTLNKWLTTNSKDYHIHEAMKGPVVKLLQAIDFSSKRMLEKGMPTQKDISFAKAFADIEKMLIKAEKGDEELVELYGHDLGEGIQMLVDAADRLVGDNNYVINQMSAEELEHLDRLVKYIKKVVTDLNKFHTVNHAKGIASLSQESMEYLDSLGKDKVFDGFKGKAKKLLNWNNALPYYTFKRYGKGGQKVFEAFQDGWDKFAFHIKQIMDYANSVYNEKEIKEWSKDIRTFKILEPATDIEREDSNYKPKYQEVQMSIPQIMSLYCLWKREQARGHILGGGIRIADIKQKNNIISQSEGVIFGETDIFNIIGTLTNRQMQVADKLQEFMNTVCSDWGNEVSMLRFGYKAFGEENYFPIQSDKNNLATEDETEKTNSLFRLLNMSFTKALTDKANNRLVISDIFDVFAQHTSDMAKYNSLALPVLDAFKWYNYKEKEMKGDTVFKTHSVKQSIESAFGKDGQNYFTTFLKDLNGDKEVSRDSLGGHFFTNAKIAAVGLNLRVVFLQPTSYVRASAIIDNKYLSAALLHKPKIDKAKKYCGMALWKSMGYYDTDVQRGVADQIKHNTTFRDKVAEVSMWGASKADELTWGYLWNACELEVRRTQKDLKVGSEEFYQAIAKRLREVIYSTQVVDSTMTRSQMMRGSDMYEKMLTAFASEPTLAYNMLQDAYMEMRLDGRSQGKKIAFKNHGKKMARVLTAYTLTNVLAAIVEAGFDAFRDDDEKEEMDLAEFMKMFLSNFASDMSLTAKIPYIKEIHSFAKGFSASRTDLQWAENLVNLFKNSTKLINGEGNPTKLIKNLLKTISDLSGIAFYNAYRDTMALLNKLDILTAEELEELFEDFF